MLSDYPPFEVRCEVLKELYVLDLIPIFFYRHGVLLSARAVAHLSTFITRFRICNSSSLHFRGLKRVSVGLVFVSVRSLAASVFPAALNLSSSVWLCAASNHSV